MSRFIDTMPGKAFGRFAAVALTLSTLMLAGATKASAQISQRPPWAVVDFVSKAPGASAPTLGRVAAEAVANEFGKTDKYDVIAEETVRRTVDLLKLIQPITSKVALLRLGQELHATSLVTGEVLNYRIVNAGTTRRADVILRAIVTDVASGLPVNGAALSSSSADRDKSVTDDELLGEAISQGAATIVSDITRTNPPTATVLNTGENSALINQGTRSGFKQGQQVVITRGREQVASGRISEVEPANATVTLTESSRGIQPGDHIRVVFQVPDIADHWPAGGGEPHVATPHAKTNNSSFIQLLLLVGLAAFLFGGGRGSNTDLIHNVDVEAGNFVGQQVEPAQGGGTAGIRISYAPDQFISGNRKFYQYQAYKIPSIDVLPSAVNPTQGRTMFETVAAPVPLNVIDTSTMQAPSGSTCPAQPAFAAFTPTTGLVIGTSYQYQVELVYRLNALDLPVPPAAGGDCYFVTSKVVSAGFATPLGRVQPTYPANDQSVPTLPFSFKFNSILTGTVNFSADYAIEMSADSNFSAGNTFLVTSLTRSSTGQITSPQISALPSAFGGLSQVYWRVGARNAGDRPGPVLDSIGQRYIWSLPQRLLLGTTQPAQRFHHGGVRQKH